MKKVKSHEISKFYVYHCKKNTPQSLFWGQR